MEPTVLITVNGETLSLTMEQWAIVNSALWLYYEHSIGVASDEELDEISAVGVIVNRTFTK